MVANLKVYLAEVDRDRWLISWLADGLWPGRRDSQAAP